MDSALIDLEIPGQINMETITSHEGVTLETPSKRSYIERRLQDARIICQGIEFHKKGDPS